MRVHGGLAWRLPRWPASRSYLAASMILALLAGGAGQSWLAGRGDRGGPRGMLAVVVASTSVPRGQTLRPDQVRLATYPRRYAPVGSFARISQVVGRATLADLATGEAVTRTRLARVRAGPVASLVPEGLRAFAVPSSLPSGALVPGDRVDVLATYGGGQPHTETVVSDVEVLLTLEAGAGGGRSVEPAAALSGAGSGTAGPTLLLLVSADQEQRLAFARSFATLQVTIDPPVDSTRAPPAAGPPGSPSP